MKIIGDGGKDITDQVNAQRKQRQADQLLQKQKEINNKQSQIDSQGETIDEQQKTIEELQEIVDSTGGVEKQVLQQRIENEQRNAQINLQAVQHKHEKEIANKTAQLTLQGNLHFKTPQINELMTNYIQGSNYAPDSRASIVQALNAMNKASGETIQPLMDSYKPKTLLEKVGISGLDSKQEKLVAQYILLANNQEVKFNDNGTELLVDKEQKLLVPSSPLAAEEYKSDAEISLSSGDSSVGNMDVMLDNEDLSPQQAEAILDQFLKDAGIKHTKEVSDVQNGLVEYKFDQKLPDSVSAYLNVPEANSRNTTNIAVPSNDEVKGKRAVWEAEQQINKDKAFQLKLNQTGAPVKAAKLKRNSVYAAAAALGLTITGLGITQAPKIAGIFDNKESDKTERVETDSSSRMAKEQIGELKLKYPNETRITESTTVALTQDKVKGNVSGLFKEVYPNWDNLDRPVREDLEQKLLHSVGIYNDHYPGNIQIGGAEALGAQLDKNPNTIFKIPSIEDMAKETNLAPNYLYNKLVLPESL
ncbi:MAG: hypothetical protein HRT47_13515 [Candidatus Caenarcaniphilales bacterium]|nr:hypothetical protein [Candidatus Caenarcaniphilales bacterium]